MFETNSISTAAAITLQSPDVWTTAKAASELNFSERRIRRLLQRGVLTGSKVRGRFGEEWRIQPFDPRKIERMLAAESSTNSNTGEIAAMFCADPAQLLDAAATGEANNLEKVELYRTNLFARHLSNQLKDNAQPSSNTTWKNIVRFMQTLLSFRVGKSKSCAS